MTGTDEPESVESLSNDDSGVWLVTTQGSAYLIDLDHRLTYRIRGQGRPRKPADGERPLLTLVTCKVGDVGHWVTLGDGNTLAQSSHRSSTIRSIHRSSARTRAEAKAEYETQRALEDRGFTAGESRGSLERPVTEIAREIEEKSAVLNERLGYEDRHETTENAVLGRPREPDDG